jgi:hypothetical protein
MCPKTYESEERKIASLAPRGHPTNRMESHELGYQVVKGPLAIDPAK